MVPEERQMSRTKHNKVLEVLERRAMRYRDKTGGGLGKREARGDNIDETGTVETEELTDDDSLDWGTGDGDREARRREVLEVRGVNEEILKVHGHAPGSKQEGVTRVVYENLNGLSSKMSGNDKLEKAKQIHHDLEVDIACYNEHRMNLSHKDNRNGFSQLFRGGEADIRSIAAHNRHEGKETGRVQEGGTAIVLFGELVEQLDFESSGKDETGLGRWVVMTFRGEGGLVTRIVSSYNPCYNSNQTSKTSYQQHRRYFLTKEEDDTCPRTRFHKDLVRQLKDWREEGDRLIVCMDANEDIYRKRIGKDLTDPDGLGMKEVVGEFTGKRIGPTFFRGTKAIDAVWATPDIEVVSACVMPAGFGVGDHRMFVIDFRTASLVGSSPPRIVRATARRVNTKIPRIAEEYVRLLEKNFVTHRMNSRLLEASDSSESAEEAKWKLDAIDQEAMQYKRNAEKNCRKIRSGRIPFSPEAAIWIRRRQVYRSLLRYKRGRIKNKSNLRRTAQRCGIGTPFQLSRRELKARLKVCEGKCEYFCKHGQAYRRRHLQARLKVAKRKGNQRAEQQILEIIRRERERALWRRLNYYMARRRGRSVRMVQVSRTDGTVREATSQRAVENAIWDNIHGKRFHLAEQAPICQGRLRGDFGYMANTPAGEAVLNGEYEGIALADQGTRRLMEEIARIREMVPKDSVDTNISQERWIQRWAKTKESTSLSESGIHFGHYIAGTSSKIISRHDALKVTLCNKWGIALDRWTRGLSCMLEKVAGCCLIDKLRSIILMEADYNANNKEVFGVNMMQNIRKNGLMMEEIFSEVGKTAEDGGLAKVLFYDIVRQSRKSAAISSVDAANCYDSIAHAIASLVFQACGVPVAGVEAMLTAIQEMRYFLRTAYGDSKNCRSSRVEVKYQGLCQGNGAAPAGWAVISITVLRAHKREGHTATFVCPFTKEVMKLAAILYVDDCDLIHLEMEANDSAFITFEKMQASVDSWGTLLIATGGSYKPPKCFFHLISFEWRRDGKWVYAANHTKPEYEMVVPMPDGSTQVIEHLSVDTPKETLGIWTAPDGSADGALQAMREKAQAWVDKAREGCLKRSDVWFLLERQFWPRVGYGLGCSTASHKMLEACLSKQYYQLLPLGGVIRKAPKAIRQVHKGFFGVGCPHPGVECFVAQVAKLLMHYGCPSSVGEQMKVSVRQLIVELGLSPQPFQHSFETYREHVTWCWLVSVWEKCERYGVKIELHDLQLELPRERDKWLMIEFLRVGYTGMELLRLNRVRRHQQALFLSDIVGVSGRTLDERYLRRRRESEKWSTIGFPQERPSRSDFDLWKAAIKQVVPEAGLATKLGRFTHKGYKLWEWRLSRREGHLLHFIDGAMDIYRQTGESRRKWERIAEKCDIVERGEPCSVRSSTGGKVILGMIASATLQKEMPTTLLEVLEDWGALWMWESLRLVGEDDWLLEAIAEGTCIAITDGSYIRELYGDVCSCAFVLECTKGRGRILGSFPESSSRACAYRGELLGLMALHLILLAANKVQPNLAGKVQIYSDCIGALKRVVTLPANRLPSGCKHSDILKNIMLHCNNLSFTCEYLHVRAHQDERARFSKLTRPAQLNCCMDMTAKRVIWGLEGNKPPPQRVFPLEPIAVFVGHEKLTSGSEDLLRFWCHRLVAKEAFADKKVAVLQPDEFEEVDWHPVYTALNEVPRMFQLWACKQVMGVAGTNGMQAKYTPNHNRRCPSCGRWTETCSHVLKCEEAGRVELLHSSIELVNQWMKEQGSDGELRRAVMEYAHGRGGKMMSEIVGQRGGPWRRLANSMDKIGWRRFMEGMLSKELAEIQGKAVDGGRFKLSVPAWTAGLSVKLMEVTHGQWLYRNVHVHDRTAGEKAMTRKDEIRRELENQLALGEEGLDEKDHYLLEINLDDLDYTTGEDHAIWVLAIRAAQKAQQIREARTNAEATGED